jgi:hypothetical protein
MQSSTSTLFPLRSHGEEAAPDAGQSQDWLQWQSVWWAPWQYMWQSWWQIWGITLPGLMPAAANVVPALSAPRGATAADGHEDGEGLADGSTADPVDDGSPADATAAGHRPTRAAGTTARRSGRRAA